INHAFCGLGSGLPPGQTVSAWQRDQPGISVSTHPSNIIIQFTRRKKQYAALQRQGSAFGCTTEVYRRMDSGQSLGYGVALAYHEFQARIQRMTHDLIRGVFQGMYCRYNGHAAVALNKFEEKKCPKETHFHLPSLNFRKPCPIGLLLGRIGVKPEVIKVDAIAGSQ